MAEFFHKVHCKLGSVVGDDFVEESKLGIEFSENDGCDAISRDGLLCRA